MAKAARRLPVRLGPGATPGGTLPVVAAQQHTATGQQLTLKESALAMVEQAKRTK